MKKVHSHSHQFSLAALFAIFIIFQQISSAAQTTQSLPQFIPPSPNAYSLGKYGDVPISLYTGVPDITIPIWTFQERDLSVDVSLSYHGSGIKVDEIASWVGLGWALNAGGLITRTIRGQPEHVISDGTLKPDRADLSFYTGDSDVNSRSAFIEAQKLQATTNGTMDTEPDEYFFNFMGRSGKFVFDKNGQAILYKHEALNIKLQYESPDYFNIIITAEDGTKYEFADYETTYFPSFFGSHITTWYLSKVTSPRGSEISFEYQAVPTATYDIREKAAYFASVLLSGPPSIIPSIGPSVGMSVAEIRIKKIVTENGWAEFVMGTQPRQDYKTTSYPLDSIIIHRSDGSVFRKFKISSSYFEANDVEKYDGVEPSLFTHLNYRLRLDAVQEFGPDDQPAKPPYVFEYMGDDDATTDDMYTLPYRLSPSQDHWGYFNDAGNEHIFPGNSEARNFTTEVWFSYARWYSYDPGSPTTHMGTLNTTLLNGANREPNAEAVKACSLKKVRYPTGGYTEYDFETNKWSETSIGGGLRIQEIVDNTGEGDAKQTIFTYSDRTPVYDPRDLYYKYFDILYDDARHVTVPGDEILNSVGITPPYPTQDLVVIKITTYPQAVLGGEAFSGYPVVKQYQVGNGYTETVFDTYTDYPDYCWTDDIFDALDAPFMSDLFNSQYINSITAPGAPYSELLETGINDWPYPEPYDNTWKRGVVTERRTFSEAGILLAKQTYQYNRQLLGAVPGYKVGSFANDEEFTYTKYYIPHAWISLETEVFEQYDDNGENPIEITTEYYHDNLAHGQTTRTVKTSSDGKRLTSMTSYPGDYSGGETFIDDMKANHILSLPIEQATYEEDDSGNRWLLSASLTTYKPGGEGLKDQVLTAGEEKPIPSSSFKFSNRPIGTWPPQGTATEFGPDSRYDPLLTFDLYDDSGNTLQYTNVRDGLPRSYVWGYNRQFPIAAVTNGRTIIAGFQSIPFDGESSAMFLSSATVDRENNVTISVDLLPSNVEGTYQQIDVMIDLTLGTEHITTLIFNFTPVSTHDEQTVLLADGDYSLNYVGKANANDPDYTFSGMFSYTSSRSTVFHTSFEEDTENISMDAKTGMQSHSGTYALVMPPTAGEFIISYWEKASGTQWTYHQIDKTAIANEPDMIIGASDHLIDEVRMYPRGAQMTTYTYDELKGMTSVTDANNVTTSFEYDSVARLIAIKDDTNNVIKTYNYHYKGN